MTRAIEKVEGLKIAIEKENGTPLIRLKGSFTSKYVVDFRDQLQEMMVDMPKRITINMSALHFIDSIGIGVLVFFHKNFEAKGSEMLIQEPSSIVYEIFETTCLDRYFKII